MSTKRVCADSKEEEEEDWTSKIKEAFLADAGADAHDWLPYCTPSISEMRHVYDLAIAYHKKESLRIDALLFSHPLVVQYIDVKDLSSKHLVVDLHRFKRLRERGDNERLFWTGESLRLFIHEFARDFCLGFPFNNTDQLIFPLKSISRHGSGVVMDICPSASGGRIQLHVRSNAISLVCLPPVDRYEAEQVIQDEETVSVVYDDDNNRISPRACLDLILRTEKDVLQPRWNAVDSASNEVFPPELVDIILSYETFAY